MTAIWKREFNALFRNVTGWLFIGLTLALFGLYFFVYNLSYGYPYVSYSLSAISFIFMVTVPLLTMRVFAEERKNRTDQLLLTSPVSVGQIVLAKFLAVAAVYTICILVIGIAPLVLRLFGEAPLAESYVGIFGFWLYGLSFIAIGVFLSACTESQVIAAVLTFIFIFLGYMMQSICSVLSSSGNLLTKILGCYDLYTPLSDFLEGTFSVAGTVYYLSLTALALFLTAQVLQKRRWQVSRKMWSFSVFSAGMIAAGVAAVILLNFGVSKLPSKYTQIDATSQKLYTITDDTVSYLKTLKDDIVIYVYAAKNSKDEHVDQTLRLYEENSDHIRVVYVDPAKQPDFSSDYSENALNANSLVVVCGEKYKVIDYGSADYSYADSQIYEYEMDPSTYSYQATGYDCEGQVTAALQYVTSDLSTTVYELKGHGEAALSGNVADVLEKRFITTQECDLLQTDAIPQDCEALFITAPTSDLSADDLEKIRAYLNGGGHVILSLNYQSMDQLEKIRELLADYQLEATEALVGETDSSYYYQNPFYLLPMVETTEATGKLAGQSSVFTPYAVGLRYAGALNLDSAAYEDSYVSYLSTSEAAFAKSQENLKRERTAQEDQSAMFTAEDGDAQGQFSLACRVQNDNGGALMVLGSAYMLDDSADSIVSGRNAAFFQAMLGEMVEEDEAAPAVVIAAKDYSVSAITVSQRTIVLYGLLWGILMPLASIVIGIIIWARRRKK